MLAQFKHSDYEPPVRSPHNINWIRGVEVRRHVEALGQKVTIVESDSSNIKITRKSDIAIAEAIIKSRPKPKPEGPIGPYVEAQW